MATLSSKGLVDDGTANLVVQGTTTTSTHIITPGILATNGNVVISSPGFYFLPASGSGTGGLFTGSVPSASSCPGSTLTICETAGTYPWCLTGSSYFPGKAVFIHPSGTLGGVPAAGTGYGGTLMSLPLSGSVMMLSDGFRWCIITGTGSMGLSGLNL